MMMRSRLSRPFWLALLAIAGLVALSYFPLAKTTAANGGATVLPSVGKPLVNLQTPQSLKVTYTGAAEAVKALQTGTATPTALATADFDADGAIDVVAGYSTKDGGVLVLYRGNPDAYAPSDATLRRQAKSGSVPATFLSKASAFSIPESPDLLVTGDFNRDGYKDVLVAARGGALYLLAGDGRGNLLAPQLVSLTGQVTALAAHVDGHVAVALDSPSGSQVAILAPGANGLSVTASYPLPASGDAIAWGNLGGGADVAVGAGANVVLFYNAVEVNAQTETVTVPFQVEGLAVGDFIWDQDHRGEISALADDGSVQILQHGVLNTAPLTPAQAAGRRATLRSKPAQAANPTALGPWTVAQKLPYSGSAPARAASASGFSSPRLAQSSTHDVMVLDAGRSQLSILDTSGKTASPSSAISFTGAPVAALALPQTANATRNLLVLTTAQTAPTIIPVPGSLTLNVNNTGDNDNVGACAQNSGVKTPPALLSLREAVCIANNNGATTSTINLPSGTYDLAIVTYGGNGSVASSGELQVGIQSGNNISIVGAGASSTIILQTQSDNRLIEQDEEASGGIPVSLSNLTLEGGSCNDTNCLDFAGDGGGAILGGAPGDNLTLTNVTVNGNSTGQDEQGGGISYFGGVLTIAGSTFTGNTAGGEGGAISTIDVTGGNPVPGSISITNSTFAGNKSGTANESGDGGALFLELNTSYPATISGSTFTGNSSSASSAQGGAIAVDQNGTSTTFSLSDSRIVGNSAPSGASGVLVGSNVAGTLTNNWWGCNGGPGDSSCDAVVIGSEASGSYNPWLELSISAGSTQIDPNSSTGLTASITTNSNGGSGFNVPNGTPVSFSATLGSVNPTNTSLTSGIATATFNSGNSTGAGSGTATVDNQTVSVTINIEQPPAITSANNTTFTVGTGGTFTVTTTGAPTPSLSESGALPNGVTFVDNGNGTATLSGPPAAATGGVYSFTITAQNGVSPNATQSFTLMVDQAAAITSGNNTSFTQNSFGTFTVTTTGFPTAGLSESGSLPNGVNFNDNHNGTATLSGTATNSGTFPITIMASNGVGSAAMQSFTLTVNPQQVSLTESANPVGSGTVSPGNGTYNFGQIVTISATPAAGYAFVNWTSSPDSVANPLSPSTTITMNNNETVMANFQAFATPVPTMTVVSSSLNPSFTSAPNNSVTFTATVTYDGSTPVANGTVSFTENGNPIANGTGVALNGSGQAQVVTSFSAEGNYNIVATYSGYNSVSMSFLTSNGSLTQTVNNHTVQNGNQFCNPGAITIPNSSGAGTPYPSNIFVTGESGNIGHLTVTLNDISSSDMPPTDLLLVGPTGAAIVPFAGVGDSSTISGVTVTLDDAASNLVPGGSPLTSGTFKPTSITGSTTLTFPAPAPTINASNFAATDGSATFGSQFNNTAPNGTWELYAQASSANGAAAINGGWCVTITTSAAPAITSANNASFNFGSFNSFTVTTTGSPTPSLSESGTLPMGVMFVDNGNGTGTLSGTPTTGGTFNITFTASNGVGSNAVQNFTLSVGQPPAITSANNATFVVGSLGSFTVTTSGSPTPSLSESGALPNGVMFVNNGNGTGTLSGTPTVSGVFSISFTASNGVGSNAVQSFTLTVDQAPAITSGNSATFTENSFGTFTVTTTGFPTPSLSESGALPNGVMFVNNGNGTGTLSGTPTASGVFGISFTASNGVGSNAVQSFTLTVSGAQVTVTPSSINFGTVTLGGSRTQNVKVKNVGSTPVTINDITLTRGAGTYKDDYTLIDFCPRTLQVGKSCLVTILFYAGNLGELTATLNVNDNATGSPQEVSLSADVVKRY